MIQVISNITTKHTILHDIGADIGNHPAILMMRMLCLQPVTIIALVVPTTPRLPEQSRLTVRAESPHSHAEAEVSSETNIDFK